jgi:hypothetical protein
MRERGATSAPQKIDWRLRDFHYTLISSNRVQQYKDTLTRLPKNLRWLLFNFFRCVMKLSIVNVVLCAIALVGCGGGGGGGGASSLPPPTITAQPTSASVYENQTAAFSVTATGSGTLTYQWKKNGASISGATAASYTTPTAVLSDSGSIYSVDVSTSGGTTSSSSVNLTVLQLAPSVVTPPSSQSVVAGQNAQFSVTAAGYPTLNYQWYKNGSLITGATNSNYSTPVTLGDSGSSYTVKVTNSTSSVTSSAAVLTVQQSTLTDLVISEISTCYYSDIDCWFEIYNPTNAAINLSSYSIKSYGIDSSNNNTPITTFTIPSVTIPPDGYAILSGNFANRNQIGSVDIKLRNGTIIPYWQSNGFIELIKNGSTVDFVIFGTLTQSPITNGKWNGANISALPYSASDYGKSIVRSYPRTVDTNTFSRADWTSVNWVTPAGRNDIPSTAVDDDGDGIPDSAEVSGGTFAGIDLYAMGARTNQKDIFIEVDQMNSNDAGIIVRKEALQKVVDSFSSQSISVHFDAGTSFNSNFSVLDFNLGQGSNVVAYEQCTTFNQTTCTANSSTRRSVYDWKEEYMDLRRRSIFHYALFSNSQSANGASGSSGLAELNGNDLIVTLGGWGLTTNTTQNLNKTINYQAGTLMHELGHNLGLRHGGFEDQNYKPNYWSVMNYLYQVNGLDPDPKATTAYERWKKEYSGVPTLCNLVASPCGSTSQFNINYSNGSSLNLNEASLDEATNIGRGANSGSYADWNLDGTLTSSAVSRDLNADSSLSVLRDYNDWANLNFPFSRGFYSNRGIGFIEKIADKVINPISADRQPVAAEYDLPR